ncbi:uncharacterized methyltransferase YdaC-like [Ruditapes philippinarum]|uniref:uncharacterized methyltransferase YdaC-like n=1 Tax=Ruditapes philippinarum TaxID=129788 RepID=UPI00295B4B96|nr:uncharacterized methyltransferase YdaC-like [Ruditapes philippinarum]
MMRHIISKNLANPSNGILGYLLTKYLVKRNRLVEHAAVRLCNIQPDDNVLEVGFGPGVGLNEAFRMVKDGSGIVHGIDISNRSFNMASRNLKQEIATGKVTLHMASVTDIPFDASKFDSIFHTNCYYFWPDMDAAAKELYRVIKPDKLMVACLNHSRLKDLAEKGFMQCGNIDPDRYMSALEKNGFYDVNMKSVSFENKDIDAIVAKARKEVT